MKGILLLLFIVYCLPAICQPVYERYKANQTNTYEEVIAGYRTLANESAAARLLEAGTTDAGEPLHLFVLSREGVFTPAQAKEEGKLVMFIMNGIHPGEPCGIDASLLLARELVKAGGPPAGVVLAIIPVYNIGGSLNRGCCSRANQNGPAAYGFRGNARLLDLNRDFIKADSRNAMAFARIFRSWDPHVLVDTHTTNGADYQYNLTLIATQPEKLGGSQGRFLREEMVPALYKKMELDKDPMIPYVNVFRTPPDSGFAGFLDSPRYSTGYAALFQCLGFVTEAHMLKPYATRVESTLRFLKHLLTYCDTQQEIIRKVREQARKEVAEAAFLPLNWKLSDASRPLTFLGYQATYRNSAINGLKVLAYDRERPVTLQVPYRDQYTVSDSVKVPDYYMVPSGWREVIERLAMNDVVMRRLENDTILTITMERMTTLETVEQPYEGHYLHYDILTREGEELVTFRKGDYVISTRQVARRYIVEVLEPRAVDSFFAWNFYDEILQQKEWFSDYVFDHTAEKLLEENPRLKRQLEEEKLKDSTMAGDHWKQLYFIYKNSEMMEPGFMRYPVGKVFSP